MTPEQESIIYDLDVIGHNYHHCRSTVNTAVAELHRAWAEIEALHETVIKCYEVMKQGVAVRISDLEDEIYKLRAELAKVKESKDAD